jgi:hypothetical protein
MDVGAFVVFLARAARRSRFGERHVARPGSKNMSKWTPGFPRNLGAPPFPRRKSRLEHRVINSRLIVPPVVAMGETKRTTSSTWYRRATKFAARRDGWQGVGVS